MKVGDHSLSILGGQTYVGLYAPPTFQLNQLNRPIVGIIRARDKQWAAAIALIGTDFVWWDFPHYLTGCLLGWLLLKRIAK